MALVHALDQHTPLQLGENGNVEHTWSNDCVEKFSQFFFQLVRTKDTSSLEKQLDTMIRTFKASRQTYMLLGNLYKMVGQTRDIVAGKGEYALSYMQIWVWYQHFPELAKYALERFVYATDDTYDISTHAYGSWKDMKYFADYVKERCGGETHPLIEQCVNLMIERVRRDTSLFNEGKPVSLAAKWCPREKSKFKWLYKLLVREFRPEYFASATTQTQMRGAYKKASRDFRKVLSTLNKYINTTQIAQCAGEWSSINFNNVTSITMRKNKLAFQNKTKQGGQRSETEDRVACAQNLTSHIEAAQSNTSSAKVHGKRVSVYELVKDALSAKDKEQKDIINLQWEDNATQNVGLGNFIPMADTSGSMSVDGCIPLYNSIGLSIRMAQLSNPEFRNRVLTFSAQPEWISIDDCEGFVDCVGRVSKSNWGMNTNFYRALQMILEVVVTNKIPPHEVENMVLAVFSDMQIDSASHENFDTMYTTIEKMYEMAGLSSSYGVPYKPPHILFWNLRSTTGFPVLSSQQNVTMLSGYSAVLMNAFQNKGLEGLKEYTPYKMICGVLNNDRYNVLDNYFYKEFAMKH